MVDPFILTQLNKPTTILGHAYQVMWNRKKGVAEVLRDGEVVKDFPYELKAHEYLNDLASLNQKDDSWMTLD